MNHPTGATAVDIASKPWALTQNEPLDSAEFIKEAQKRGFHLRTATLRELYRHRLLIPLVQIAPRPVGVPAKPEEPESPFAGTRLTDLRWARDTGRLRDLAAIPYQPRLSIEPPKQSWPATAPWTGVLYSPYQLLALPELQATLTTQTFQKRGKQIIARLPKPSEATLDHAERLRKIALALTALEARYLPTLDPEFIQLSNVPGVADWARYRANFDPVQMQAWLTYPSEQLRQDAEWLLYRAHRLDPVGDDWSQLMRRAPAKSRQHLKDAALVVMDDRIAAEILLRFYEDLALRGQAEPLPDLSDSRDWHPLDERLSSRRDSLDEALVDLGISPHPRVVLALEGRTELYHAPLVIRALGYSEAPELVRLLNLRTVNQNLQKVVALNVAPLVNGRLPGTGAWKLTRPSAHLIRATDPDAPFNTPENVEKERIKLLKEIKDVLNDQGVEHPNPKELENLVEIRTWDAPCYEFAHFSDDELADGIMAVHQTIDGWTRDQLVEALGYWRHKGADIDRVWLSGRWDAPSHTVTGKWEYDVSKVKLAKALWPVLAQKIEDVKVSPDAPIPPLVVVIRDAYRLAQRVRYLSFVLTETPGIPGGQQAD